MPNGVMRCKFKVIQKSQYYSPMDMTTVKLCGSQDPVFGKATPFANVEMTLVNEAADRLELGKEYFVDFSPAE